MILGIGIDLVSVDRIQNALERYKTRFLNRIYAPEEIRYCSKQRKPAIHYAGRFAAKEAFAKALGTGFSANIKPKEIFVESQNNGRPKLSVRGEAQRMIVQLGVTNIHLSLSHLDTYACAVVILES